MLRINKITQLKPEGAIVYLVPSLEGIEKYGFTTNDILFAKYCLEQDIKLIPFNLHPNWSFILVAEGGKTEAQSLEKLRLEGCKILSTLHQYKSIRVRIVDGVNNGKWSLALAEGIALSSYEFLRYRSDAEKIGSKLQEINILSDQISAGDVAGLNALLQGVAKARDLVNEPVVNMTAEILAKEFKKMGAEAGFEVEVFGKEKIQELKMGGLLAVNLGSIDPPTFTTMTYKPSFAVNEKPIILVGKGVVFDTGGLSLKPTANSMDYMKCDMSGAAAVGGAMYSIAKAQLPVYVIALVPATDNRPDGNAYAPGDVITMYNGKTVEVLNCDAEGRLILADALHYAKQFEPELVIDIATLTGAAANAIGKLGVVAMGNTEENMAQLKVSGNNTFERIAEVPFWEEYAEFIKSDIADLCNIGGPEGGMITAGKFLEAFTDYPWIHLDIAGPAFSKKMENYRGKGASGVGVRLFYDFLKSKSERT